METPIYLRRSGSDKVKLHALVAITDESGSKIEIESNDYLSVDSESRYYLKRKATSESPELWLVELHATNPTEQPYTYTAIWRYKYRDLPEGWIEDE